jgi:predicted ArsR family transcriptional regulator
VLIADPCNAHRELQPEQANAHATAIDRNDLPDLLLTYLRANPGQRAEQIAAALGTDSRTLRPAMKRLTAAGKVRSAGQKRSTTYTAV